MSGPNEAFEAATRARLQTDHRRAWRDHAEPCSVFDKGRSIPIRVFKRGEPLDADFEAARDALERLGTADHWTELIRHNELWDALCRREVTRFAAEAKATASCTWTGRSPAGVDVHTYVRVEGAGQGVALRRSHLPHPTDWRVFGAETWANETLGRVMAAEEEFVADALALIARLPAALEAQIARRT